MITRRNLLEIAVNALPGTWGDETVLSDTTFPASRYTKDLLKAMLWAGKVEFLRDLNPHACKLEVALIHGGLPLATVRCSAVYYAEAGHYDLDPDPGARGWNKLHPLRALVDDFDERFREIKPNPKARVQIRIRG